MHDLAVRLVTDKWFSDYEKKGAGWLPILSNSMSPMIQTGDQICISKTDLADISTGDIITFWRGSLLITHRVVRKIRNRQYIHFFERGERSALHSLVHEQAVVGKVVYIKKSDSIIDLNSLRWRMLNKIIGTAYYYAFVLRMINRKFPYTPEIIIKLTVKIFSICMRFKDKILRYNMAILN